MSDLDQLATALAEVHKRIKNPERNKRVTVNLGTPDEYEFSYATLDSILAEVRPILSENGLSVVQELREGEKGGIGVSTTILHASGQFFASFCPLLTDARNNQGMGSAISYLRRYALCAVLNIVAQDDDDANLADGNKVKVEANPTAKQSFGGPLTKTELKKKMRAFAGDLSACDDMSALEGLVGAKDTIELLAQCARDLPTWYMGDANSNGAFHDIEAKRKELGGGYTEGRTYG